MDSVTAGRKPVVLVVEDELLVRTVALEMVEQAGFEVIEASNADEAIRILESVKTSVLSLRTFRCPVRWTVFDLRALFATVGLPWL
jgi:CheY-like chemotaxis protein